MDVILNGPHLSGKWIAGLLYVVLSVGLEYVPAFSTWWEHVPSGYKRRLVAGAGWIVVAALVALHYAGAFGLDIGPFGWDVVGEAFQVWLTFVGGNWAVWSLVSEQTELPRVRRARERAARAAM